MKITEIKNKKSINGRISLQNIPLSFYKIPAKSPLAYIGIVVMTIFLWISLANAQTSPTNRKITTRAAANQQKAQSTSDNIKKINNHGNSNNPSSSSTPGKSDSPGDSVRNFTSNRADNHQSTPNTAKMIAFIVKKNIFEPARKLTIDTASSQGESSAAPTGPKKLNRPFEVVAIDKQDGVFRAHLLFENTGLLRPVEAGEEIEFVKILKIYPTYLRCQYGKWGKVRIDLKETSNDAIIRLNGYNATGKYDLIGTTILNKKAWAYFRINGRDWRVEEGDKLGNDTVVKIENGKVLMRFADGEENYVEPSRTTTSN